MPNNFESKHDDYTEASTGFPKRYSIHNNVQFITFYTRFVHGNEHFQSFAINLLGNL